MEYALSNKQRNGEKTRSPERRLTPPVDIYETSDGFTIVADLPGVESDALSVEYNPPELHVTGRIAGDASNPTLVYERRFELGSGIDPTSIEAELKQGVLRVVAKKSAALKPRRIDVRAS
jgi:HSP20 family molecular chaperone IbpA